MKHSVFLVQKKYAERKLRMGNTERGSTTISKKLELQEPRRRASRADKKKSEEVIPTIGKSVFGLPRGHADH